MMTNSQNDQYILTKPRDAAIPGTDHHVIKNVVSTRTLPLLETGPAQQQNCRHTVFPYITAGILLVPPRLKGIKFIVQVET